MGKLYLVSGDDDFGRKRRVRELILTISKLPADADPEDNPDLEIVSGDADDVKINVIASRFLESLRTPPFLSPEKLLWLRHFPDFDFFNTDPDLGEVLTGELSGELPQEVTVVIDAPGLDQRKQFARKCRAAGAQIEILNSSSKASDRRWEENRRTVIIDMCRKAGLRISGDAVQYLAEAVGGDTGILINEMEKLFCYIGGAVEITLENCRDIISCTTETLSWEYNSAIVDGNPQRALKLLSQLMTDDSDAIGVLMSLSGEFQRLQQTVLAMQELGVSQVNPRTFDVLPESVRQEFPDNILLKMHPYRAFKVCESAMRFTPEMLAKKLSLLRDANQALVSGKGAPRMVLERLTLALTCR